MKNDYLSHLFFPPEKNTTETLSDVIDDKLSRLLGRDKSPKKKVKKIKDDMILYSRPQN